MVFKDIYDVMTEDDSGLKKWPSGHPATRFVTDSFQKLFHLFYQNNMRFRNFSPPVIVRFVADRTNFSSSRLGLEFVFVGSSFIKFFSIQSWHREFFLCTPRRKSSPSPSCSLRKSIWKDQWPGKLDHIEKTIESRSS